MKTFIPTVRIENAIAAKYKQRALQFFNHVSTMRQQNGLPFLQRYTAVAEGVMVCAHCSDLGNWVYLWGGQNPISGLVWRDDLDKIYSSSLTKIKRHPLPAPDFYYGCRHWSDATGKIIVSWNSFVVYDQFGESGGYRSSMPGTNAGPVATDQLGIYMGGKLITGTDAISCIGAAVCTLATDPITYELRVVTGYSVSVYALDLKKKAITELLFSEVLPDNETLRYSAADFNATATEFIAQCSYQNSDPLTRDNRAVHGVLESDSVVFADLAAFDYGGGVDPSTWRWFGFVGDVVTEKMSYTHTPAVGSEVTYSAPSPFPPAGADITKIYSYVSTVYSIRRQNSITINGVTVASVDQAPTEYGAVEFYWDGSAWTNRNGMGGPYRYYGDPATDIIYTTHHPVYNEVDLQIMQTCSLRTTVLGGFDPPIGSSFVPPSDHSIGDTQTTLETHTISMNGAPIISDTFSGVVISTGYNSFASIRLAQALMHVPFDVAHWKTADGVVTGVRLPLNFIAYDWSTVADNAHWAERLADWEALGSPMIMLVNGVDILTECPPQPAVINYVKAYMRANDLTGEVTEDIIVEALKGMNFGYLGVV